MGSGVKLQKPGQPPKPCPICSPPSASASASSSKKRTYLQPAPPPLLATGPRPLQLVLEFDGAGFIGSQLQPADQGRTVQGELEKAARRLTGEQRLRAVLCSRTDAGVHATGMVALLRTATPLPLLQFRRRLNAHLPADLVCRGVAVPPLGDDFEPRKSALGKRYRYTLVSGPVRPVLARHHAWHLPQRLDLGAMRAAAAHFVGETRDFSSFTNMARYDAARKEKVDNVE